MSLIPDLQNIVESYIPLADYKELISEIPEIFTLAKYKKFQNILEKRLADDINTRLTNDLPIIIQNIEAWKIRGRREDIIRHEIQEFINHFNLIIIGALKLVNLFETRMIFYRDTIVYLDGYQLDKHFYNISKTSKIWVSYNPEDKRLKVQRSGIHSNRWDEIIHIGNLSPLYQVFTRINNSRQVLNNR